MDLLLIRHAESTNNATAHSISAGAKRSPDPELTAIGHEQAALLAKAFQQGRYPRPTHLYSSLMLRAVQTARPLAAALGLATVGHLDAFEIFGPVSFEHGNFAQAKADPGGTRAALEQANPSLVWPAQADPAGWWPGPVEGVTALRERRDRLAKDLLRRHGGPARDSASAAGKLSESDTEVVALVSHGSFLHGFLHTLLGSTVPKVWIDLPNTSVTLITGWTGDLDPAEESRSAEGDVNRAAAEKKPGDEYWREWNAEGFMTARLRYCARTSHLE